jgi:hypothetical protein
MYAFAARVTFLPPYRLVISGFIKGGSDIMPVVLSREKNTCSRYT